LELPVAVAVLSAAKELGVNVIVEHFGGKKDVLPSMFSKKLVDGVLVFGKMPQEHVLAIKHSGFPVVLCGHPFPQLGLNVVMSDGRAGMYAVTKHLVQLGHKNIVYLTGGPRFDPVTSDRLDGFRYALNEAGVKLSEVNISIGDFFDMASATRAVEKINKLDKRPSALICESDALAYAAYQGFVGAGYNVPGDISITGFDNLPIPNYINAKPKLTTVDVNLDELGRISFNALLDVIEDPARAPCRLALPVRLKIQETTGPANEL
jgi:LacI family transcriptional regulator